MNKQQLIAIGHHCRLACEVVHPRFHWEDGIYQGGLTVNSGYE